ncbi:unnamed protein product [Amoebophrya sp. A25]|nr:unnamed protein product [Amoebophrya sp. A25]|eukprot:GSA25T00009829001.1
MLQFLAAPVGEGLSFETAICPSEDGDGEEGLLVAQRKESAIADARISKVAFIENLVSKSEGRFFEFKVEHCLSGFIPGLAVGFSSVDPTGDGFPVPRRACEMDDTVVVGYTGKVYLASGEKNYPVKWNPGECVVARGHDRIGCLLTTGGELVVYHNKAEVVRYKPRKTDGDLSFLLNASTLYGVVDVYGGTQRLRLNPAANVVSPVDEPDAEEEGG